MLLYSWLSLYFVRGIFYSMLFKLIDITGKKFGKLSVTSLAFTGKRTKWNCICDCGNKCIKEAYALKNGRTISCGCERIKRVVAMNETHGLSNTPLYDVFQKMRDRCYNENNPAYKNYGDRGIKISSKWLNDFTSFYDWCMENGYEKGLEIDRRNNDKGYYDWNCRIVSRRINANNKRNNVKMLYNGKLMGMMELESLGVGISSNRILRRIRDYKWSIEKAINTPLRAY